jgi:hypothetical protein
MVRVRLERDSTTQCDAVVREGVSVSRCVCPAADLAQLIWPEARNRPRLADLAAVAYDASSNVIGMRAFRGADVIREALHADDDEAGRDGRMQQVAGCEMQSPPIAMLAPAVRTLGRCGRRGPRATYRDRYSITFASDSACTPGVVTERTARSIPALSIVSSRS